jgi:hypothetical protein
MASNQSPMSHAQEVGVRLIEDPVANEDTAF